ncbi:hypothetical protein Q3G72_029259 [Acer saccharum]|nr:hypothetical protein Q3G72_029259 [Acer saccharum]
MDKSWIHESRLSSTFEDGVTQFLDFAFVNNTDGRIKCPCKNCNNTFRHDRNTVEEHMICDGIDIGYFSNKWIYHGELDSTSTRLNNDQSGQVDDMHGMLHNAFGVVDGGGGEFDGVDLSCPDNDNSGGGDENDNGGDRPAKVFSESASALDTKIHATMLSSSVTALESVREKVAIQCSFHVCSPTL